MRRTRKLNKNAPAENFQPLGGSIAFKKVLTVPSHKPCSFRKYTNELTKGSPLKYQSYVNREYSYSDKPNHYGRKSPASPKSRCRAHFFEMPLKPPCLCPPCPMRTWRVPQELCRYAAPDIRKERRCDG